DAKWPRTGFGVCAGLVAPEGPATQYYSKTSPTPRSMLPQARASPRGHKQTASLQSRNRSSKPRPTRPRDRPVTGDGADPPRWPAPRLALDDVEMSYYGERATGR